METCNWGKIWGGLGSMDFRFSKETLCVQSLI
jgi:hypothetical protein